MGSLRKSMEGTGKAGERGQWKKGPEGLSGAGQEVLWRPGKDLGFILGVI